MPRPHSIGKAITFMEQHLKEPITIEAIARASGFSKSTLQRRFLDATNVTVALFLRRLRLNAAAAELVASKRRILDIALDYQFESQATFARAFKQATWLTPAAARRLKRLPDLNAPAGRETEPAAAAPLFQMRGVMLFSADAPALARFYHEVLGFPILDPDPNFTQLDAGGPVLVVHQGGRHGTGDRWGSVEITFFTPDVEATRRALIERGVKAGPVAIFGDLRLCKAADPDGNIFGFSNRRPAHPADARSG